jgi:hypothetical protein
MKGIDRWSYEVSKNAEFLSCLKELTDIDYKCEVYLGDDLKRGKIRFLYESGRAFYDSPARSMMLSPQDEKAKVEAENIIHNLVPKLTSFKTLVYMHEIDKRKKVDFDEQEKQRKIEELAKKNNPVIEEKKEEGDEEEVKKEEEVPEEEDEETIAARKKEEAKQKQDEEDRKYGRYWIWEGILLETYYPEWRSAADLIDGLNQHVIEDIQDYVIKESFKPDTEDGKKVIAQVKAKIEEERKEKLSNMKEEDKEKLEVEIKLENLRPDKGYWNFFIETDSKYFQPHKFR